MKRVSVQYLLFITLSVVCCFSCSKKIDLVPEFSLDGSQPLSTLEQADFVLTGAYKGFLGDGYFNSVPTAVGSVLQPASFSGLPDMMSDDLVETFEDFPNYRKMSEWTYAADETNVQITFANAYNIISGVNIILRDIDAIAASDANRAAKIKAQALTMRAMVHFDLLRYFAPNFDRNSDAPGIAYIRSYDATAKPARNSVKECYDNIFKDINDAITVFGTASGTTSGLSKMNVNVAYALLSRVSLYAGQWQQCVDASTRLIDEIPLADMSEFPFIWTDDSQAEVIWSVSFQSINDGSPYENVFFARGNKSLYRPTLEIDGLYDALNDVRYDSYIANVGNFNGIAHAPRLTVIKHRGKSPASPLEGGGFVDWKVFRVSEMYLNRAEAYFQLGNEGAARADINMIRENRIFNFPVATETGPALLDVIKTERRKELAFEGQRFFDLKRWNKTAINRCAETNTPSNICTLTSANRAWALPIPESEMNANPSMQQNPGY